MSITSVYNKLNGLETSVSAALVRDSALELGGVIHALKAPCSPLLPGYRVKRVDGNCLEASEHRLKALRDQSAAALPGKSLVVYDPALEMAVEVFPCEDGHAQERSLLPKVLEVVEHDDVWVMDRNFCVRRFLLAIAARGGYFICRHHPQMPYTELGPLKKAGQSQTGEIYEQWINIENDDGTVSRWRHLLVKLKKKTRDGNRQLSILTNLPKCEARAPVVANLYRQRWTIETLFQQLEAYLNSEINALAYPKAALFGFSVALVAYNMMAVVKGALRRVHGEEKIAHEVSGYYIAGEIGRTHEGMTIAIPPEDWTAFQTLTEPAFISLLMTLARNVKLEKYKKHRRGPKKEPPKKTSPPNTPHVSTAKLLKGTT